MKFKYQSKHKSLLLFKFKSIKHIARVVARVLAKSFFYLGAPPICPRHQLSLLSLYPHCPYIGYCLCYPNIIINIIWTPICWALCTLCSMSSSDSFARCASFMTLRKWSRSWT
ncbi:uncharacterized protein LOC132798548 [Drosophila nasuta]|uniref:uncharacterized protein LOC132798548 n=1 Tax=Drosophila nasuta TaxID=42062 RepID=UPI00295E9808|nr:uncharacterized protein LOC132798548 [Drosophila nasuta]